MVDAQSVRLGSFRATQVTQVTQVTQDFQSSPRWLLDWGQVE